MPLLTVRYALGTYKGLGLADFWIDVLYIIQDDDFDGVARQDK